MREHFWKRGIELARAEYVTFCHDDDMLQPYALSLLMNIHEKTGIKAIFSIYNAIDGEGNYISNYQFNRKTKNPFLKHKRYFNYTSIDQINCCTPFGVGELFNKKCMIELGGYNEDNYPSGDLGTHLAYTHYYGSVMSNIPIFNYRKMCNASFSAYKTFASDELFFHECEKKFTKLPSFIFNILIQSKYRWVEYISAIYWGGLSEQNAPKMNRFDIRILRIFNFILRFFKVEFALK